MKFKQFSDHEIYFKLLLIGQFILITTILPGCSTYRPWANQMATHVEKKSPASEASKPIRPMIVAVTLSGGGARAAAFGLGVLRELKSSQFSLNGKKTTLLDEVSLISGVSGGSILAAHFAAFGDETLSKFESDFLLQPFEDRLLRQALWPTGLYRLTSPWYGRTHLLAERLDTLYQGMTFEDVRKRPNAPELIITATDLTTGAPFDFTPEQFARICSDLGETPLSFAVAASSAVPVILSPMTLKNFANDCPPDYFIPNVDTKGSDYRARMLRKTTETYRNSLERPFIHLVDGGVVDNLGVRMILDSIAASGSMSTALQGSESGTIRRVVLITVNSERALSVRVDASDKTPTIPQVLESLLYGAGARITQSTLAMLDDDLQLRREEILQTRGLPDSPFASDAELHVVTVSLHDVSDDKIRHSLLRVPTAFTVEAQDVNDLLEAGSEAVRNSVSMKKLMQSLERLD